MTLHFVGTSSGQDGCPSVYVTDRGTLVIQGTTVTDTEAIAALRARGNGLPAHESAVEVPAALLPFLDVDALRKLPFADSERPEFAVNPEAVAQLAAVIRTAAEVATR